MTQLLARESLAHHALSRRRFLRSSLLGGVAVASSGLLAACVPATPTGGSPSGTGGAGPASGGQSYTFKLNDPGSPGWTITDGVAKFGDLLKEKSGGKVQIQHHHSGSLGFGDREGLEAVLAGTIEMARSSSPNTAGWTNLPLALDLPYIVTTKDEVYKVMDGEPGTRLQQEFERIGFKLIMILDYGFRQFFNNRKAVVTPADLAGMKVRTTASPIEIADYEAFGALPTAIAWAEVYSALQQKVVEGEGNTYDLLWPTKHWEHLKYGTEISYNYSFDVTVTSQKYWTTLPKDVQDTITAAAKEAISWQRQNAQQSYDAARENFKKQGIQIQTMTPEQLRPWRQAVRPVWDKFVAPGKAEPEFVELILKTIGKTRESVFA